LPQKEVRWSQSIANEKVNEQIAYTSLNSSKKPPFKYFLFLVHVVFVDFYNVIQVEVFLCLDDFLKLSPHAHHSGECQAINELIEEQKYQECKPHKSNELSFRNEMLDRGQKLDQSKRRHTLNTDFSPLNELAEFVQNGPVQVQPNKLSQNPENLIGLMNTNKWMNVELFDAIAANVAMVISEMRQMHAHRTNFLQSCIIGLSENLREGMLFGVLDLACE